jgi:hypothetical protein
MGTRAAATAAACDLGSSVEEFSMNEVRTHPQVRLAGAHRPLPTHSNILRMQYLESRSERAQCQETPRRRSASPKVLPETAK